ncbi:MAG: pteridine reductase [Gammaproteobacteria bacterium RIFCSPHIGHO2_12_FULL_35_23]|nr:MAG: pteridine reductase [Gammaproteobacteria bacterium RIFCSPHIGHO2_12_FULL_35_23]
MKDKVVLITGAAKRVGACIAKNLHSQGMRVIIHYRASESSAKTLVNELNTIRKNSAACLKAELNNKEVVEVLAEQAQALWGQIDALVNNASSFYPTKLGTATEAQWEDLFASNVKAPFFLAQKLIPTLKVSQGSIVNIADIHADRPLKDYPIYSMAKAALVAMTKAMAKDLAPEIRVNAIAPGMILWPDDAPMDKKIEQYLLNRIALKRFGEPQYIAEAVWFLLQQSYITGQVLAVDGGRSLII